MVGATTLDEYRKHIEKDAALERRFQPVLVGEPNVADTIAILRGLKEKSEVHHGVRITDNAIVAAATLSDRYIGDRFCPTRRSTSWTRPPADSASIVFVPGVLTNYYRLGRLTQKHARLIIENTARLGGRGTDSEHVATLIDDLSAYTTRRNQAASLSTRHISRSSPVDLGP